MINLFQVVTPDGDDYGLYCTTRPNDGTVDQDVQETFFEMVSQDEDQEWFDQVMGGLGVHRVFVNEVNLD